MRLMRKQRLPLSQTPVAEKKRFFLNRLVPLCRTNQFFLVFSPGTVQAVSNWSSLYFQEPGGYVIEEFVFFHDYMMFYIIIITFFVLFIIVFSGTSKNLNRELLDYDALEVVWIIIPLIILLLIGVPSLMLLYLVEEKLNWLFSVKIRGHQWY